MSYFFKYIERTISFLKRDQNYKLDASYSLRDLFLIVYYRFLQIIRGFVIRWRLKKIEGLFFCGRNVTIEYGYYLSSGRSLIIEDGVNINALSEKGIILGDNVTIGKNSVLVCTGIIANKGEGIEIGNNSSIGSLSFLGGQGGIKIGNEVIMGPNVKIFSENHIYIHPEIPIRKQGESRKGVIIEDNCWIGSASIILDGVTIGSGTVIGAGSIVTKSIPRNSVAAGSPAKIIKSRVLI